MWHSSVRHAHNVATGFFRTFLFQVFTESSFAIRYLGFLSAAGCAFHVCCRIHHVLWRPLAVIVCNYWCVHIQERWFSTSVTKSCLKQVWQLDSHLEKPPETCLGSYFKVLSFLSILVDTTAWKLPTENPLQRIWVRFSSDLMKKT